MSVNNNVVLGLDIGIGSIGWVLIEENQHDGSIQIVQRTLSSGEVLTAAGVRLVDVPEDPKTKELLSKHRRDVRRQRVTIQRRAKRMRDIRALLSKYIYHQANDIQHMYHDGTAQSGPWYLRRDALDRKLNDKELAIVLYHLAKHRGFQSNSKVDTSDKSSDSGKMLTAVSEIERNMQDNNKRTLGEYLAGSPDAPAPQQRNRSGMDGKPIYTYTPLRRLLKQEADAVFAAQAAFGNAKLTPEFCEHYKSAAFDQRPLQSRENLIGRCAFLENEKRAPKFSPSAERFSLAQRLCILRIVLPDGSIRPLTAEERSKGMGLLGKNAKVSYSALRKQLALPSAAYFENLGSTASRQGQEANPEARDVVRRTGACGTAHALFLKLLGKEAFADLKEKKTPNGHFLADQIGKIISDNDDLETIRAALRELALPEEVSTKLYAAVVEGKFNTFKGTMRLSLKAMYSITPELEACGDYSEACDRAGFDHTKTLATNWRDIRNPLVQHMLREVRRQVKSIERTFDIVPGSVHIELARDFGKSIEDRKAIEKGIEKNTTRNDTMRKELAELLKRTSGEISSDELTRYKLWKEQGGKCCYYMLLRNIEGVNDIYKPRRVSEGGIDIRDLCDGTNAVQIDHILPYSRTYDSSYHNLGLCLTAANQMKGNRSPYEWIGASNAQSWHEFTQWVESLRIKNIKRRNYLLQNLKEKQERFTERNLNDTRYITRVIQNWFAEEYYPQKISEVQRTRRVFARPGQLTAFLRKVWGLDRLKKDSSGARIGDRHHALDAFVVACCKENLLHKVTKAIQRKEEEYIRECIPLPMPNCNAVAGEMLTNIFPSRAEHGKINSALHEDTLRSIVIDRDNDGKERKMLYLRTPIHNLTIDNLSQIKDAHRCHDVINALKNWLNLPDERKVKDVPRSSVTGFPIKKVKLCVKEFKSGIEVRRGATSAQADNGKIVRTDVFTKDGKYYLVPVYAWQIMRGLVPNKAIVAHKDEDEWIVIDESFHFHFSMYPNTYIVADNGKEVREGYFAGTDRSTGAITLAIAHDRKEKPHRVGTKKLVNFDKYRIDRLGQRHKVKREKRPAVQSASRMPT
jgi:CRISPR-associated endonuclease Csn1